MAIRGTLNFLLRRALPALAVAALLLASLKLAEDAAGDSARFAAHYRWVLGAAAIALAILAFAIGQRLWRLRGDIARDAPGARLNRRLLRVLILLALPPIVVVYGFALRFLDATVDNWFNVRLEQALDDALELGRVVVDEHLRSAEAASAQLAQRLATEPPDAVQRTLDDAIEPLGAIQLSVFGDDGRSLATASSDPRYLEPLRPDSALLMRVQGEGRYAAAEPLGDALALRIALRLAPSSDVRALQGRLLQGIFPLPARLQPLTRGIENASFDFQRLKFLRGSLKLTFALILTFVLFLSVLVVVLAAFGVARRLVAPIGRLAAATRAVGAGRYDTPLPAPSDDELGFLVHSFAQMTRELEFAGARAQKAARETEQQRAWLEAVLERLSAGVLGFDRDGRLRVANRAAEAILGIALAPHLGRALGELRHERADLAPFIDPLARHLRENLREWREEVVVD
ncbi:MAG: HAMP domain-containing protein, partial [Lysobacterales bacterium]